jgi:geranylgeranyl diphosphate synthase type II
MDAEDYLKIYSPKADRLLDSLLKKKKSSVQRIDPNLVEALGVLQNYFKGGKKIRGALTILGYESFGGKNYKAIFPASLAIELFHCFLLIHDDVIDKDSQRRGKPTIHSLYAKVGGEHFGNSKAIMIGDLAAFLAYELLASLSFPKERIIVAATKLNDLLLKTAYGQLLDMDYDFKKEITWGDILKVRTYKTAYYTFVMPLSVGALLAGAKEMETRAIEKYGVHVGIAFQLVDDVLGVFGSTGKTGKSNLSDIREGKKTFLYAKALELSTHPQKIFLKRWYGSEDVGKKEAGEIRKIFASSGSLDYSMALAKDLTQKGKRHIPKITKDKKYQKILESFADFVVTRQK